MCRENIFLVRFEPALHGSLGTRQEGQKLLKPGKGSSTQCRAGWPA